jgi:hypothetical protein
MGDLLESLTDKHIEWAMDQKLFFVSTAPLSNEGHINCSPKGGDCFAFANRETFIYADYTGSGNETIAHLHENGRILIMLCSFEGPPRIMRLYGRGVAHFPGAGSFEEYSALLPENPGLRSIIEVSIERASVSCGFSVPYFKFVDHRDMLDKWAIAKGPEGVAAYRQEKNQTSIDGLTGYGQLT